MRNQHEQTSHPTKLDKMPKPVKNAIIGAVAVGALFGIYETHHNSKEQAQAQLEAIESEAVNNVETAFNGAVVINAGAAVRSEPRRFNPDPDVMSIPSNVSMRVDKDSALIVNRPLQHRDADGELWYGFHLDTEEENNDKNPLYWVNATALEEENDSFVQTFENGDPIDVSVSDSGNIVAHERKSFNGIAEAELTPLSEVSAYLEELLHAE